MFSTYFRVAAFNLIKLWRRADECVMTVMNIGFISLPDEKHNFMDIGT